MNTQPPGLAPLFPDLRSVAAGRARRRVPMVKNADLTEENYYV